MRNDGTSFRDYDVHRLLKKKFVCVVGEWYKCGVDDVRQAIQAVRERHETLTARIQDFAMRPEQKAAVKKTQEYFRRFREDNPGKAPRFLWNAKMRFGKTFTSYEFAKAEGYKRVLILTFKPAVADSWRDDLESHKDFEGWQYISRDTELTYDTADKSRPIVCFGSFQDYLGKNEAGGIKARNEWVHEINWDLVIFDEYHFGAWRDSVRELFESEDSQERNDNMNSVAQIIDENLEQGEDDFLPITTRGYLFLSGTPFRAIANGEFIEEQIFNWTYADEQRAKENWIGPGPNPYEALPRVVLMTYQMPDQIREIASGGEFDEFDLNEFFDAKGDGSEAIFKHESDVQKWLDLMRGNLAETTVDNLKMGARKPPMPFSDSRLKNILTHTFWFLPSVSSCYAMANLLKNRQNVFFHDYHVNVAAGPQAGIGLAALDPVRRSMTDPLESKTITLSCGKLTTGVTVRPWTGIFMLRNLKSPETYFQAAFRVQSPWTIENPDGEHPNQVEILKKECYIFDFAPTRALRQIADYSCSLNPDEGTSPEESVGEFIHFLPVLAYDGSSMKRVDATDVLDIASAGTSATLLAKRWESTLLVNVDNITLKKLMGNQQAMDALMSIEGFRNLNNDLEVIINKSEHVKDMKKKTEGKLTADEKKAMKDEEREYKSIRKQVQEKLIKFATRIPVFMYLTDYREQTLKDVITKLEPDLFKKVTGLTKEDFELLLSLNVFNSARMNDAVYKFKRYEDDSLSYTGIYKRRKGDKVGGFDTVITHQEFEEL
nr:DEAD/DEAH box helicase family protein [Bifidobacterium catenulatum]